MSILIGKHLCKILLNCRNLYTLGSEARVIMIFIGDSRSNERAYSQSGFCI